MSIDKVVSKIVALGVPGLVLVGVISVSGLTGAAALVAALATLGGPFGMLGGIAALGLMVLISQALSEYGIDALSEKVIFGLLQKGLSKSNIIKQIEKYPISRESKLKLKDLVSNH